MAKVEDKAGKEFWDEMWSGAAVPTAADPALSGLGNLFTKRIDKLFSEIFRDLETQGKQFLELGCGSSIWLPYFAKHFGFKVTGVDYSEIGCRKEVQILRKAGVDGDVVQADFFKPPEELIESFDFVYSSGVAEHFTPTEACLSAFAAFLKPGGTMITTVPNMTGAVGWLQRSASRSVFDIHVLLTDDALRAAHEKAGLEIVTCEYFLSTGFGIANTNGENQANLIVRLKNHLLRGLGRLSVLVWLAESKIGKLPATKLFSPYIFCVARKKVAYD